MIRLELTSSSSDEVALAACGLSTSEHRADSSTRGKARASTGFSISLGDAPLALRLTSSESALRALIVDMTTMSIVTGPMMTISPGMRRADASRKTSMP